MLFFIGGLFLGSLLNNIAYRIEKEEDFVYSRSKCTHCGHTLSSRELIPVLSFLLQAGKCAFCKKNISFQYPVSEIITGIMTLGIARAVFGAGGGWVEFLYLLFFFSCFFIVALLDLKTTYIDERIVYAAFLGWLIFHLAFPSLKQLVFSGSLQYFFSSSGAFMIGLFLHPADAVLSFMLAILLGGIAGIYLLFKYRKMKKEIPYVPFLFVGTFLTCIYGAQIISFYMRATL
ncbi:MAG: Type 4 prepilin-like protein leader peptide-processing enzyme [Parcubacteria group bacterium GW2011_GWC1_41_7]|nr:MAG: Type 4 prepilin-like protein leader peptide-processing enzyme [Parcubacteria group bacterium GW2011_GWC1_41_7]